MGCFIALVALFSIRLALALVWIFTVFVDRAFDSFIIPLLGLIFLPATTLVYSLAYTPAVGVTGFEWFLIALAFIIDLGSFGGASRARNR
jgi:hypothetical protein